MDCRTDHFSIMSMDCRGDHFCNILLYKLGYEINVAAIKIVKLS